MDKKRIYLDNSATTPIDEQVCRTISDCLINKYGNPSSLHSFGQEAKTLLDESRSKVAELLNAEKKEEIIFTSGGTESDNLAIKGIAYVNKGKGNHIITSSIEHHAVLHSCKYLEKNGFDVTYLPVDKYGKVSPESLTKAITPKTILVSIMHANNEVGTIQPISDFGKIIKDINKKRSAEKLPTIYFHTDAVQTAGKLRLDVQQLGVDLMSVSAHKFYGPKGIGVLYLKQGTRLEPIIHGGHHEKKMRAGTENLSGIVAIAKALEIAIEKIDKETKRISDLRNKLEKGILEKIPSISVNGHPQDRICTISNISFQFIEGEGLLLHLDLNGVACSTGSACASGSLEPSHVLKAMGIETTIAQGAIRFSLGYQNTEKDIDYVLEILPGIISKIREMSPLWQKKGS
ncbi:cysteine desulfurase NifS [Elusimicrobiota bacterium]